jgi:hypothetical protein
LLESLTSSPHSGCADGEKTRRTIAVNDTRIPQPLQIRQKNGVVAPSPRLLAVALVVLIVASPVVRSVLCKSSPWLKLYHSQPGVSFEGRARLFRETAIP